MGFTNIMRHECHPKLKTFSFSSELVLLCAKLDPAFFVRCYQLWCNVNCYFECSKCIKKSMIPLSFVIFQKIFCFISVSCYFAFDFVFSYNMAKHVRKTDIHYLNISMRFRMRMIQSWIWNLSFLLTFCKHLSLTRKKM